MKTYIQRWTLTPLAMLLLWSGAAISQAQETAPATQTTDAPPPDGARPGPPRAGPEHRLAMLQHELGLSTEQTAQVKTILAGERTQMQALRSSSASATPEERHTQMKTIRQSTDAAIKAVLTADQAVKFDAMDSRMRAHRPGQDGPPPPPNGVESPNL